MVTSPAAPHLCELDLSSNSALTWRCCQPLAQLLARQLPVVLVDEGTGGGTASEQQSSRDGDSETSSEDGAAGAAAAAEPLLVENPVRLKRLMLGGVQLGDKGAVLLAEALRGNHHLKVKNMLSCLGWVA